ncbi:hypothetical protein OG216_02770 [Streptomycetaceae bacterium NBC_01309]
MALPISLVDPQDGSTAEAVLGAHGDTTVRTVADCLEAARALPVPAAGADVLYHGERRLDPDTPLRDIPLLPGARIGVGAPLPRKPADAPRRTPADPSGDTTGALVEIRTVSGPRSGRVWALDMGVYDLGDAPGCALRPADPEPGESTDAHPVVRTGPGTPPRAPRPGLPARAATVTVAADGVTTIEPHPGAHAELDGTALDAPRVWRPGSFLAVGDQLLALHEPFRADAAVEPTPDGLGVEYNRPPRISPVLEPVRIMLPHPAHPPQRRPLPVLMSLAPLAIGVAMAFLLKSSYFLIFAVFSPVLAIAAYVSDNRYGKTHFRRETAKYRVRRAELNAEADEADEAVEDERAVRRHAGPDPAETMLIATGPGRRLWERRRTDLDRLLLRVGTADLPSEVTIDDPEQDDHRRTVRPIARDVPVQIPLPEAGVLGIAGDHRHRYGLARWLVTQVAVLHSPRDVRLHVLCDAGTVDEWSWCRWLPHSSSGSSGGPYVNLGTDGETVAAQVAEIVATVNARLKTRRSTMSSALHDEPELVVVLDGARRLREVSGVVQILRDGPSVGVYAICLDRAERLLPEETFAVVLPASDAMTVRLPGNADLRGVRPDLVAAAWCERGARALAPLRDGSRDRAGTLPDVVRHGPHALVAGTTGAG